MAWIEPVTNRTSGAARMTYNDMTRIAGDVAFLQTDILGAATISKTTWYQNDIITVELWHEILDAITELGNTTGTTLLDMSDYMGYDNINNVETNLLLCYGGTASVEDMQAYGDSIVDEDDGAAYIADATFLSNDTMNTWTDIIGG